MVRKAVRGGFHRALGKPGLTVLIYSIETTLALAIAFLLTRALSQGAGHYGDILAGGFDLGLWYEALVAARVALVDVVLHLYWIIPLYLVWDAVSSVGLTNTLYKDGGFWRGVWRHGGGSLLIGMIYIAILLITLGVVIGGITLLAQVAQTPTWRFYIQVIGLSVCVVFSILLVNLMRDASRTRLVIHGAKLVDSIRAGFSIWPMVPTYAVWTAAGLLLVGISVWLENTTPTETIGATVILAIGLQILALIRAAVRVVWHGSLVELTPAPSLPADD